MNDKEYELNMPYNARHLADVLFSDDYPFTWSGLIEYISRRNTNASDIEEIARICEEYTKNLK